MKKIWTVTKMLALLGIREPLSLMWNGIFPSILFFGMYSRKLGAPIESREFRSMLAPFVAYIVISASVYGSGLIFVSWRECGFLRTFVQNKNSKWMLICSQLLVAAAVATVYASAFIACAFAMFNTSGALSVLSWIPLAFALSLITSAASMVLNVLPYSYQTASTTLSILMAPMLVGSSMTPGGNTGLQLANLLNPMDIVRMALEGSASAGFSLPRLAISVITAALLATVGLIRFRSYSSENR